MTCSGRASSEGISLDPATDKGAEADGRRVGGEALSCAIGVRSDCLQIVETMVEAQCRRSDGGSWGKELLRGTMSKVAVEVEEEEG